MNFNHYATEFIVRNVDEPGSISQTTNPKTRRLLQPWHASQIFQGGGAKMKERKKKRGRRYPSVRLEGKPQCLCLSLYGAPYTVARGSLDMLSRQRGERGYTNATPDVQSYICLCRPLAHTQYSFVPRVYRFVLVSRYFRISHRIFEK